MKSCLFSQLTQSFLDTLHSGICCSWKKLLFISRYINSPLFKSVQFLTVEDGRGHGVIMIRA